MSTFTPIISRDVAVSCAFNENAIQAISREYHRLDRLAIRLTRNMAATESLAGAATCAVSWGGVSKFADRLEQRATTNALPVDHPVAPLADPLRILGGRRLNPLSHSVGNATWKIWFGRAAARVPLGAMRILFGMPGSCLEIFEANPNAHKVFHAIDAHPRSRNTLLHRYFGIRRAVGETYPERFIERIEQELSLAEVVLVPSEVVGRQMIEFGVSRDKILKIPYGVDLSAFAPPEGGTRKAKRPKLICVAQVSLRKGIPFLLDSVRGLDVDVEVVGPVFDRSICDSAPSNVTFRGAVSRETLISLYQNSDAFVLPSIEDACALVTLEAAACGIPVITTSNNGAAELLASESARVVPPGDTVALREAIHDLTPIGDEDRMMNAYRVRSETDYQSWHEYSAKVLKNVDERCLGCAI